ncbi:UNVERIFIED_CONTAM: cation-transporting P-type ATPase [Kocuria sp. CPCC 205274]
MTRCDLRRPVRRFVRPRPWHHLPVPLVLEELGTGPEGLPETEADTRRPRWGTNELTFSEPVPGDHPVTARAWAPRSWSAWRSRSSCGAGWDPPHGRRAIRRLTVVGMSRPSGQARLVLRAVTLPGGDALSPRAEYPSTT